MNKYVTISTSAALLSGLFLIASCSSSGDGGSAPANAVTIADSITAETTVTSAVASGTTYISAIGAETSTTITARDALNIVLDKMNNNAKNATSVATGITIEEDCLVSGSTTENGTGSASSFSGTVTFNSCNNGGGIIMNGSMSGSGSYTEPTGPFSINLSGNLTITFDNNDISVGFNGFNYISSGDDSNGNGDYTVTTFTYTIAPSNGGGFAMQLTQPLVGNEFVSCQLISGQVLVSGAGGSQARGTVNSDGTVKVEYHNGDGNFVVSDNSPLSCLL